MASPSLALGFASIERPHVAQRLIRSVRRHFPDLPIYVADQSRHIEAMSTFYASHDVTLVRMPYDAGVAASRNRLAREIREEYFVLCDDDYVVGAQTRFDDAVRILEAVPEIGVVGGRLFDFDGRDEYVRNWEVYFAYDPRQRILFSIPIYELAPKVREVAGMRFYLCDSALNFAVFRRSMLSAAVQWDERFKSNGEHEDFFLNLKLNSSFRVAHLPTMLAYHHHPDAHTAYETRLRARTEGWQRFYEKWGLEQYLELGLGVRTADDGDAIFAADEARSRFFVNADGTLQRAEPSPDILLVGNHQSISTVGALDETGNRAAGNAAIGSVLLGSRSREVIALNDRPSADRNPPDEDAFERDPAQRYALEASGGARLVGAADDAIYFRHDAILSPGADVFLWYLCKSGGSDRSRRRLAAVARWSADDSSTLLWRSRRMFLDLEPADYWRPLMLEPPVPPRGCRWLRFDVVTDGGANAHPLCTGFLFASPLAEADAARPLRDEDVEVVCLSRIIRDGATPGRPGAYLEHIGRACPRLPVTLHSSDLSPDMSILLIDELAGVEVLFFAGWDSLGRSLVSARLPPPAVRAPAALTVPKAGWRTPGAGVYGYGERVGFIALSVGAGLPARRSIA